MSWSRARKKGVALRWLSVEEEEENLQKPVRIGAFMMLKVGSWHRIVPWVRRRMGTFKLVAQKLVLHNSDLNKINLNSL
jgi:hypothetical protein